MKYNDRYTAKLILRKSGSYMKLSLLIFITMIALLCYSLLFYISYTEDNLKNYSENEIVHIISFEGKFENNTYRDLCAQDKEYIQSKMNEQNVEGSVGFFYSFVGAILNNEDMILIIGVDKDAEQFIVSSEMEDNIFYTNDINSDKIQLDIPSVDIDENGNVNIDSSEKITFPRENVINNRVIDYFSHDYEELYKVYVTEDTFFRIINIAFDNYVDYTSALDSDTQNIVVDSAYVTINDIYDIDNMAKCFTDIGYDITYTFSAFDAMGKSIRKNGILFFLMITVLLIVSSVNLILSLISYIDMSKKDMGILKFMGYSNSRIYIIYKRNVNSIFALLWGVAVVFICILTVVTICTNYLKVILYLSLGVTLLLVILNIIVSILYLKKVTNKNILYLIKETKQFE